MFGEVIASNLNYRRVFATMADTQDQQKQQQQQAQGYDPSYSAGGDQQTFDRQFVEQISQGVDPSSATIVPQVWQAYFDQAEQTLRTARRISEIQALHLMTGQIVAQIVPQVTAHVLQKVQQQQSLSSSQSRR